MHGLVKCSLNYSIDLKCLFENVNVLVGIKHFLRLVRRTLKERVMVFNQEKILNWLRGGTFARLYSYNLFVILFFIKYSAYNHKIQHRGRYRG